MKKMFTKSLKTILVIALAMGGFAAKAQTASTTGTTLAAVVEKKQALKVEDKNDSTTTSEKATAKTVKADPAGWTPVRRLWGYAFGDLYFDPHADATNRGPETMYNG